MAQDLSSRIPTIIQVGLIEYLAKTAGLLGRTYTRKIPENALQGGDTVKIHKPASIFTPTAVDYTAVAAAQEISTPSTDLTVNKHYEVKVTLTELEDIYSTGGKEAILADTVPAIIDGLITQIDSDLMALYSNFTMTSGAYDSAITDAHVRSALRQLANKGVDTKTPGKINFITDTNGYYTDLLGIDRYVTPLNLGQVNNPSAIISGRMPSLFGVNIDWSQNIKTTTVSGNTVAHSLMFEKYGFAIGFTQFNPANAAQIKETLIVHKPTGAMIRQQFFYDQDVRSWVGQWDVRYGVCALDANRFVRLQHKIA